MNKPHKEPEMSQEAEMFTERCRRLLTEQPTRQEFTLSRVGLETLVSDAELCAERALEAERSHEVLKGLYLPAVTASNQWKARADILLEALKRIETAPAWGHPDRWETTPAEVRQLARAAIAAAEAAG